MLIVGAGSGLSASLARVFAKSDMAVALAARTIDDLAPLAAATGAKLFACDATDRDQGASEHARRDHLAVPVAHAGEEPVGRFAVGDGFVGASGPQP